VGISHYFLVPLLDSVALRWTASLWRRSRPWVPWAAALAVGAAAIAIPSLRPPPFPVQPIQTTFTRAGWSYLELNKPSKVCSDTDNVLSASLNLKKNAATMTINGHQVILSINGSAAIPPDNWVLHALGFSAQGGENGEENKVVNSVFVAYVCP